jgi:hypothetical protein
VATGEIEANSGKAVLTGLVNYDGNFVHPIRGEDKITVRPGIKNPGQRGRNKQQTEEKHPFPWFSEQQSFVNYGFF